MSPKKAQPAKAKKLLPRALPGTLPRSQPSTLPSTAWQPVTVALADSGPLLALFNASDRWHGPVRQWLALNPQARLHSTWPVLTEVCALLARRIHNEAALDFLRWVQRGALQLDETPLATIDEVLSISERFASLPFDLADASVAEAAARLGIRHVLSIDADFDVYRDKAGRPLLSVLRG